MKSRNSEVDVPKEDKSWVVQNKTRQILKPGMLELAVEPTYEFTRQRNQEWFTFLGETVSGERYNDLLNNIRIYFLGNSVQ